MNDPEIHNPDICDNLRRIVPDDLSPARLVDGARRKRARRNGVVGALAALSLVAVAVPVALNLPTDGPTVAQPATTTSQTPDVRQGEEPGGVPSLPGARACYNDDGTPISWSQVQTGPAEPGAVKAWFCGDYSPETGMGFVGPIEPLMSGLDTLIADVQAADVIDLTLTTCLADYNLSLNAVFEYPDGSRRIIGGDRHGCRTTYDGGVARAGADEFYGALYNAWVKQRQSDTDDWVVPTLCPGPQPLIPMGGDAVRGAVCAEDVDGSGVRSAAFLDEELLGWVEGAAFTRPENLDWIAPTSTAPEQRYWITLSNKFSDHMTFVRHEDGVFGAHDGEGNEWFWNPGPELAARLDEALANAGSSDVPPAGRPVEPPGTAGPVESVGPEPTTDVLTPWVAPACKDAPSGDLVSTDLPDGALPGGAERVWLCASGALQMGSPAPPLEPLEDPGLVAQAAAAFNDLTPMPEDQACTMELGPSYLVVHEYADGTRYAVEIQDYGCRPVTGGSLVKENSELYTEKLLDLWGKQRTDRGTTQTRPGPLCSLTDSMFVLLADELTATSGTACVGSAKVDDVTTPAVDEVAIPAALLSQINAQLSSAPLEPSEAAPDGDSIVLLTKTGDPFVLFRLQDRTFYWPEGEYARLWTPTGEAADALTTLFGK